VGDHLKKETLDAFFDELELMEKEAFRIPIPGFLKRLRPVARAAAPKAKEAPELGWKELGYRITHPWEGVQRGWKGMARPRMTQEEIAATGFRIPFTESRTWQAGKHLGRFPIGFRRAWGEGGVKGLAEEASRAGWTGRGKITKYVPWGQKSWLTGFGGLGAYETATAPEGKKLQTGLGELAGTGGWLLSGGLTKTLPTLAAFFGPSVAGGIVGGKLDRMMAASKLKELGLTPEQINSLNDDQIVQLLSLHRQYTRGGG